jgi:hypothetical protein
MKRKLKIGIVREFDYYQVVLPVNIRYPKKYKDTIFESPFFFNNRITRLEVDQILGKAKGCEVTEISVMLTLFDINYSIRSIVDAKWLTDKKLRHILSHWTPTSAITSPNFKLNLFGELIVHDPGDRYIVQEIRDIIIDDKDILKTDDRLDDEYLIARLYQMTVRGEI